MGEPRGPRPGSMPEARYRYPELKTIPRPESPRSNRLPEERFPGDHDSRLEVPDEERRSPRPAKIVKVDVHASLRFPGPPDSAGHWDSQQVSLGMEAYVNEEDPKDLVRRLQGLLDELIQAHKADLLGHMGTPIRPQLSDAPDPNRIYLKGAL